MIFKNKTHTDSTTNPNPKNKLIKRYFHSLKETIPKSWLLLAALLAPSILFIFLGKSFKYALAIVFHNLLFVQMYILWKQVSKREWIYATLSILPAILLFILAGKILTKSNVSLAFFILAATIIATLSAFLALTTMIKFIFNKIKLHISEKISSIKIHTKTHVNKILITLTIILILSIYNCSHTTDQSYKNLDPNRAEKKVSSR